MKSSVPEYIQNPALPITISVIGCGGTGSIFLQNLAKVVYAYTTLTGRRISVIVHDGDRISTANVGRQAFGINEVLQFKAHTIVSRINRFYGFEWLANPQHFKYERETGPDKNDSDLFHTVSANFLFSAVDNVATKKQIQRFFHHGQQIKNYPEYFPWFWIDMGNTRTTGNVTVASEALDWPDIFSYEQDFVPETDDGPSCTLAMALNQQDLFVNPLGATIAAKWFWECLQNKEMDWRGAFYNVNSLLIRKLKVKPIIDATKEGIDNRESAPTSASKPAANRSRTKPAKKGARKTGNRSRQRQPR